MALELPKSRLNIRQIQTQQRRVPVDQIIAVQGASPIAAGIQEIGQVLGQTLQKRAELKRQGEQIAQLAALSKGQDINPNLYLTPEMYEKGMGLKSVADAKKAEAAKQRVDLELKLEQLKSGYIETDPTTGKVNKYPGVQGLSIDYDQNGNPMIKRAQDYSPKQTPKSVGGAGGGSESKLFIGTDADGSPLIMGNKSGTISKGNIPGGGSVLPKNQAGTVQKDVKDIDNQIQQLGDLRNMLKDIPGGAVGGVESLSSRATFGAIGGKAKQYNDIKPSVATKIYRAMTGDTRLSDADAAARAYPLLPSLAEPLAVREAKIQNLERNLSDRKANLMQGGGLKQITPPTPQTITPRKIGGYIVEEE